MSSETSNIRNYKKDIKIIILCWSSWFNAIQRRLSLSSVVHRRPASSIVVQRRPLSSTIVQCRATLSTNVNRCPLMSTETSNIRNYKKDIKIIILCWSSWFNAIQRRLSLSSVVHRRPASSIVVQRRPLSSTIVQCRATLSTNVNRCPLMSTETSNIRNYKKEIKIIILYWSSWFNAVQRHPTMSNDEILI